MLHAPDPTRAATAPDAPLVLGLGGTMRFGSSSSRALEAALGAARHAGVRTTLIAGPQLDLPAYDVAAPRTAAAERLIDAVRRADGLIIASPSYHGGISGLLKNALDHLEELRGDARPYLHDRPVGLIATGDGWQGPNATLQALRLTVHAMRGWPTPLGVAHNISEGGVEGARAALELVGRQVAERVLRDARDRAAVAA
ncbi:NAD(P)H-dependent oxidoreductase [Patulibacter brassicae]|uniref:NAD(P)H-dependent oxidoreductase n=1 Tax=Patulibacter brassicae TaxID=1705717 RepID=A0ABU4VN07_9ACTN|nr:NAD(P)H-dependent oxidoreductase [Patulibacter brassicae]MDX8153231.1 NAD(P)H-dependent oxidoreductase [Patulibacter brassicae]